MTLDERLSILRERHRLLRAGIITPKARRKRPRRPLTPGQSQARRWQLEMQAEGRCQSCGGLPLVTRYYCEPCRVKCNARVAARRLKKGAVPLAIPQRCTVCDERGHNAKRHRFVGVVTP